MGKQISKLDKEQLKKALGKYDNETTAEYLKRIGAHKPRYKEDEFAEIYADLEEIKKDDREILGRMR